MTVTGFAQGSCTHRILISFCIILIPQYTEPALQTVDGAYVLQTLKYLPWEICPWGIRRGYHLYCVLCSLRSEVWRQEIDGVCLPQNTASDRMGGVAVTNNDKKKG